MSEERFASLPLEQQQEYVQTLVEDLGVVFVQMYREHPLQPLIQAWCTTPMFIDTIMKNDTYPGEERRDIIQTRTSMSAMLITLLVHMFIRDHMLFRSPNFHITFQNTDGTTGNIIVDNLQASSESCIKKSSIRHVL